MHTLTFLAEQASDSGHSATAFLPLGGALTGGLIGYVLSVLALWPVFRKAGLPGWGAIIPIYNTYLLVKTAGYHGALVILYFIPLVNIIVSIVVAFGVGKAFGKGGIFSFFMLWLLAIIGYFIIGYGRSQYRGRRSYAVRA